MKKLKRTYVRITWALCIIFITTFILAMMFREKWIYYIFFADAVLYLIFHLATNRCPHCRTVFEGISPFRKDAGYCRKCGQKMEFDK